MCVVFLKKKNEQNSLEQVRIQTVGLGGESLPPSPLSLLSPPLSLLSLPLPPLPPLPSLPLPSPFPLEVGPLIAARGSGGALKLPQRVRAEPGRQTCSGAF